MKPKAILFDMDGTLLPDDKKITRYTADCLMKAHDLGIRLVASTGRPPFLLDRMFLRAGLENTIDAYIALNGVGHVDKILGINELSNYVEGSWIPEIIERVEKLGFDGTFVSYRYVDAWITKKDEFFYNSYNSRFPKLHFTDFKAEKDEKFWKLIFGLERPFTVEEIERLDSLANEKYHGYLSLPNSYEFTNVKVSKGNGVRRFADEHGFSLNDLVMFGDSGNDIDAMELVGYSVAMGNAGIKTKEISNEITQSNNDDGVARWIKKELL